MEPIVHIPKKDKWEFDAEVTNIFEDMLKRSIPQYEVMRQAVANIAEKFAVKGGYIVDLGCSRGDVIADLISRIGGYCHYTGVDISEPMIDACNERFKGYFQGIVKIVNCDLRREYPEVKNVSVTTSVLTMQFTPIEYRQQILRKVYNSTRQGGIFILVEKVLGADAVIDDCMVDLYYKLKSANGYSTYEIERKRLSLEGVLVPITSHMNEEFLRNAGFTRVDCFWRWMNFAGWVAVKD